MCGDVMCGDVMCSDVMCGDVMCGGVMKFQVEIHVFLGKFYEAVPNRYNLKVLVCPRIGGRNICKVASTLVSRSHTPFH